MTPVVILCLALVAASSAAPFEDGSYHHGSYEVHNDFKDDGTYHHDDSGAYHGEEHTEGDDGSYRLLKGVDDGQYHGEAAVFRDAVEDGHYHVVGDDGSYHHDFKAEGDDGSYKAVDENAGVEEGQYRAVHGVDDGSYRAVRGAYDDGQYHEEFNPVHLVPFAAKHAYVVPEFGRHLPFGVHPYGLHQYGAFPYGHYYRHGYDFPHTFGAHYPFLY